MVLLDLTHSPIFTFVRTLHLCLGPQRELLDVQTTQKPTYFSQYRFRSLYAVVPSTTMSILQMLLQTWSTIDHHHSWSHLPAPLLLLTDLQGLLIQASQCDDGGDDQQRAANQEHVAAMFLSYI